MATPLLEGGVKGEEPVVVERGQEERKERREKRRREGLVCLFPSEAGEVNRCFGQRGGGGGEGACADAHRGREGEVARGVQRRNGKGGGGKEEGNGGEEEEEE